MNALKDVSKVWLVAKMVHTLFESILGNKVLEEKLQKAAGRRHAKNKQNGASSRGGKETQTVPSEPPEAPKRKFDEMELGYTNGPPVPQMSYERSRPQSPAITPSREVPGTGQALQPQPMPQMTQGSPTLRHGNDAFMGTSRANTRPTTPFNNFSYPGTPPDLFLHTRNSPKISEDIWQNYAPDQLFPPETNALFPIMTNSPTQQMVDPVLRGSSQQHFSQHHLQTPQMAGQPLPLNDNPPMTQPQDPGAWAQLGALHSQLQSDDAWSNSSSAGGPIVPTTLNVGDWFEFFGIPNGSDINGLNGAASGYG
jgi:hypothetical protein